MLQPVNLSFSVFALEKREYITRKHSLTFDCSKTTYNSLEVCLRCLLFTNYFI